MKDNLILGLGNEYLSDDGIGVRIANYLSQTVPTAVADCKTLITGGLDILEHISGYKQVIIFDAIKTNDAMPGDIFLYSMNNYMPTLHLDQFHDVGFPEAIKLAKELELDVPAEIFIFAVNIHEDLEFATEFSPCLQEKYSSILDKTDTFIHHTLKIPTKK